MNLKNQFFSYFFQHNLDIIDKVSSTLKENSLRLVRYRNKWTYASIGLSLSSIDMNGGSLRYQSYYFPSPFFFHLPQSANSIFMLLFCVRGLLRRFWFLLFSWSLKLRLGIFFWVWFRNFRQRKASRRLNLALEKKFQLHKNLIRRHISPFHCLSINISIHTSERCLKYVEKA